MSDNDQRHGGDPKSPPSSGRGSAFADSGFFRALDERVGTAVQRAVNPAPTREDIERIDTALRGINRTLGEVARIDERIAHMDRRQAEMMAQVSRNIHDMRAETKTEIEEAQNDSNKAHKRIDAWKSYVMGGLSVATFVGGAFIWLIEKIIDRSFPPTH